MNKKEQDRYYMHVAQEAALNSKAERLQVGAILVRNNQIISDGFNGTPSGFDNVCEDVLDDGTLKTRPEVLHAESNAITKCARYGHASEGSTLYVTHSPCIECAKMIIQAGIKKVIYKNLFKKQDGLELLRKAGIELEKY